MNNQTINIDELATHIGNYIGKLILENFLLKRQINELANALNQQIQQTQQKESAKNSKQPVSGSR